MKHVTKESMGSGDIWWHVNVHVLDQFELIGYAVLRSSPIDYNLNWRKLKKWRQWSKNFEVFDPIQIKKDFGVINSRTEIKWIESG